MDDEVKIIHQCQVSPPQGSLPSSITLPLSYLDLPYFYCPHIKRIFFYNFPHSTQHFLQTSLPILKKSLSLTLQHFFPFSSKTIFPPKPQTPHILYSQGDSITLTICESKSNFNHLISNSPKDLKIAHYFASLIPSPSILQDGTLLSPTLAIQITVFPNYGFTICLTFRHEICDGKSFHHFIKFWSSLSKGNLENSPLSLPLHNRDMIHDPKELKHSFLEQIWNSPPNLKSTSANNNLLRHRFILTRHQVENLKKWVLTKSQTIGFETLHLSTFVVTCSLFWVCMVKTKSQDDKNKSIVDCDSDNDFEDNYGFRFLMDLRNHFEISTNYFGNCLGACVATLPKWKLVGENGICEAVNSIGREIKNFSDPLIGVEKLMFHHRINELGIKSRNMILAVGSPKFNVYETDFGWGKPLLSENIHVDDSNILCFSDSKDEDCVIELGMVLDGDQMKKFSHVLEVQLRDIVGHK
jgi:hypothetical protein